MGQEQVRPKDPVEMFDEAGDLFGRLVELDVERDEDGAVTVLRGTFERHGELVLMDMAATEVTTPIQQVWDHYVEAMQPRRKVLDNGARVVIRAALDVATAEECKRAIDGCAASAFHMGKNDRNKKYNRLSQILRGKRGIRTAREQIDLFLDVAADPLGSNPVPSGDAARVGRAKEQVRDATEFPGDATVVQRGEEAERWLREQYGITYEREAHRFSDRQPNAAS